MAGHKQRKAARQQAVAEALNAGLVLQKLGRLGEAEKIYLEILDVDPSCFDALHMLALLRHAQGRRDEALVFIDRALRVERGSADALANRGSILLRLGRAEEALATCERALVLAPRHIGACINRGNALQALGRHADALASYDKVLASEPGHVQALTNRGNALQKVRRVDAALASYDRALAADPDFDDAWTNRGVALDGLGRLDEALASHERAVALDPRNANAWSNRASTLQSLGRPDEALASADAALALDPDHVGAWSNRGNALRQLGRYVQARASYDRALALQPNNAEVQFNDGILRLTMGDFGAGWDKYEFRWRTAQALANPLRALAPQWSGAEPLAGRTIMLFSEQGLGDTIQLVRYVPQVAQAAVHVLLSIDPGLTPLRLPLADNVTLLALGADVPPFDLQCPLLGLPRAFAADLANIPNAPYVAAPPERIAAWAARLPRRSAKRVGLVWAGNPAHRDDRNRSIALARLLRLLDVADVELVALQRDLRSGDEALLRQHPAILPLGHALADFADTAAIVGLLDLVIAVDSSVAHLAGAMGAPVCVLLPFCPDWRWLLDREDSPWYPSAHLIRQPSIGDWDSVIDRVARELAAMPD
jgi:tetratricopeptide (TPR) repeat protein